MRFHVWLALLITYLRQVSAETLAGSHMRLRSRLKSLKCEKTAVQPAVCLSLKMNEEPFCFSAAQLMVDVSIAVSETTSVSEVT